MPAIKTTAAVIALLPAAYLLAIAWPLVRVDLREHRLPNRFTYPGLIAGVVCEFAASAISWQWWRFAIGVALTFLLLAAGVFGNHFDLFGMGDVKLAGAIALALAWFNPLLPLVALLAATSVAAAISMWLVFRGTAKLNSAIPLGPYLLLGLLLAVVWLCAQPGSLTPA